MLVSHHLSERNFDALTGLGYLKLRQQTSSSLRIRASPTCTSQPAARPMRGSSSPSSAIWWWTRSRGALSRSWPRNGPGGGRDWMGGTRLGWMGKRRSCGMSRGMLQLNRNMGMILVTEMIYCKVSSVSWNIINDFSSIFYQYSSLVN